MKLQGQSRAAGSQRNPDRKKKKKDTSDIAKGEIARSPLYLQADSAVVSRDAGRSRKVVATGAGTVVIAPALGAAVKVAGVEFAGAGQGAKAGAASNGTKEMTVAEWDALGSDIRRSSSSRSAGSTPFKRLDDNGISNSEPSLNMSISTPKPGRNTKGSSTSESALDGPLDSSLNSQQNDAAQPAPKKRYRRWTLGGVSLGRKSEEPAAAAPPAPPTPLQTQGSKPSMLSKMFGRKPSAVHIAEAAEPNKDVAEAKPRGSVFGRMFGGSRSSAEVDATTEGEGASATKNDNKKKNKKKEKNKKKKGKKAASDEESEISAADAAEHNVDLLSESASARTSPSTEADLLQTESPQLTELDAVVVTPAPVIVILPTVSDEVSSPVAPSRTLDLESSFEPIWSFTPLDGAVTAAENDDILIPTLGLCKTAYEWWLDDFPALKASSTTPTYQSPAFSSNGTVYVLRMTPFAKDGTDVAVSLHALGASGDPRSIDVPGNAVQVPCRLTVRVRQQQQQQRDDAGSQGEIATDMGWPLLPSRRHGAAKGATSLLSYFVPRATIEHALKKDHATLFICADIYPPESLIPGRKTKCLTSPHARERAAKWIEDDACHADTNKTAALAEGPAKDVVGDLLEHHAAMRDVVLAKLTADLPTGVKCIMKPLEGLKAALNMIDKICLEKSRKDRVASIIENTKLLDILTRRIDTKQFESSEEPLNLRDATDLWVEIMAQEYFTRAVGPGRFEALARAQMDQGFDFLVRVHERILEDTLQEARLEAEERSQKFVQALSPMHENKVIAKQMDVEKLEERDAQAMEVEMRTGSKDGGYRTSLELSAPAAPHDAFCTFSPSIEGLYLREERRRIYYDHTSMPVPPAEVDFGWFFYRLLTGRRLVFTRRRCVGPHVNVGMLAC
ncbi:hypothetical protein BDK51DRAFT_44081 [Blyttiomyces helicus]|uniref:Uncharacterized protein n=1 Tax=Blyttiomyces helicus TaxID=388810 RepID=A0A4P9WLL4_9FUNG|nr:hypothetical protein BDK51DRAFT_44081 [Blyttiomyces helicus]|eukprot:RKO93931.1 hypothetical protein BDK51DRAFT_44081 [Blyttiomyces helicus]